ncbi:unnamed protein product [Adineta ricciae]|uniref:Uncharacterized protein n=1 Tax=Adineta ricciae TaxID=249248 RepID=A0A814M6R5_ADIRI|nr:unnamed protein product [Adineta ricciae]CAF1075308.1 unnamed protein product [Adineta ricciae]
MIFFLVILLSLSWFLSIHAFYVTNAAILQQCPKVADVYLSKFDSKKLSCHKNALRHLTFTLTYTCQSNKLTSTWALNSNDKRTLKWPTDIYVRIDLNYKSFDLSKEPEKNQIVKLVDDTITIKPNVQRFSGYMWTSSSDAPYCRFSFLVAKECSGTVKVDRKPILEGLVCYYGQKTFQMNNQNQRDDFTKLIDDAIKSSSNSSSASSVNNNLQPLTDNAKEPGETFWKKYKIFIFIGGGVSLVVILAGVVIWYYRSSNNNSERRTSTTSTIV